MFDKRHAKKGNVLLLTLFVMSAMLLGAAALSGIVLRSLRSAGRADAGVVAYAAAEGGAERALFELRKRDTAISALPAGGTYQNGATVSFSAATSSNTVFVSSIPQDQVYELSLFYAGATPPAGGVNRLVVRWLSNCSDNSVMEIQHVNWTPGSGWNASIAKFRYAYNQQPVDVALPAPATNAYRVRLRPEGCDANNVRIDAFDGAGQPVGVPDRATVVSNGSYAGVRQAVQIVAPLFAPLSAIYDFVLFSECSITKDGSASECPGDPPAPPQSEPPPAEPPPEEPPPVEPPPVVPPPVIPPPVVPPPPPPASVCGNGIVEPPEACDDGIFNGFKGFCAADCGASGGVKG